MPVTITRCKYFHLHFPFQERRQAPPTQDKPSWGRNNPSPCTGPSASFNWASLTPPPALGPSRRAASSRGIQTTPHSNHTSTFEALCQACFLSANSRRPPRLSKPTIAHLCPASASGGIVVVVDKDDKGTISAVLHLSLYLHCFILRLGEEGSHPCCLEKPALTTCGANQQRHGGQPLIDFTLLFLFRFNFFFFSFFFHRQTSSTQFSVLSSRNSLGRSQDQVSSDHSNLFSVAISARASFVQAPESRAAPIGAGT